MAELSEIVHKVRSKNAGPFWLTIDIFCGSKSVFQKVSKELKTEQVAELLQADAASIKRFDIASLNVVKLSLPRPTVQGSIKDRDMHGASWGALVSEIEI